MHKPSHIIFQFCRCHGSNTRLYASNHFIIQIVLLTAFFGTLPAVAVLTKSFGIFLANCAVDLQRRLIVNHLGSVICASLVMSGSINDCDSVSVNPLSGLYNTSCHYYTTVRVHPGPRSNLLSCGWYIPITYLQTGRYSLHNYI